MERECGREWNGVGAVHGRVASVRAHRLTDGTLGVYVLCVRAYSTPPSNRVA